MKIYRLWFKKINFIPRALVSHWGFLSVGLEDKRCWLQNRYHSGCKTKWLKRSKTRRGRIAMETIIKSGEGQTDYEYINETKFTGEEDLF